MINAHEMMKFLPPMLSGDMLVHAMEVLPDYDEAIRKAPVPVRLVGLSDLYQVYLPSAMSSEIYSKLYLALLRSLQKKGTREVITQKYENHKAIRQQEY